MSAIKAIHASARSLGLDDDSRRDLYERTTGKRSLTLMTNDEQTKVLKSLRASGAKVAPNSRKILTGPFAKKLQALWLSGWDLGIVKNRDDKAMLTFLRRQTGIENTRFLRDPADARKAVEALKSWLARDANVMWAEDENPQDAVIVAQARLLKLQPGEAFSVKLNRSAVDAFKAKQAIINDLGKRIRAEQNHQKSRVA